MHNLEVEAMYDQLKNDIDSRFGDFDTYYEPSVKEAEWLAWYEFQVSDLEHHQTVLHAYVEDPDTPGRYIFLKKSKMHLIRCFQDAYTGKAIDDIIVDSFTINAPCDRIVCHWDKLPMRINQ